MLAKELARRSVQSLSETWAKKGKKKSKKTKNKKKKPQAGKGPQKTKNDDHVVSYSVLETKPSYLF